MSFPLVRCAALSLLVLTVFGPASVRLQADEIVDRIIERFSSYDYDQDGILEIDSLRRWPSDHDASSSEVSSGRPLVVLIEARLTVPLEGASATDARLNAAIDQWLAAMRDDGWHPIPIVAGVYTGERHQDGKTVLALRRLLQQTYEADPKLGGAILVGSFPEASLVRRWIWKHADRQVTFDGVTYNGPNGPRATFLAMDPELIAPRTDLVLCDLDGAWESLYREAPTEIEWLRLLPEVEEGVEWPVPDRLLRAPRYSAIPKRFEDFFLIEDCDFEIVQRDESAMTIRASYQPRRPETTDADRQQPNPIARPEISVSRIDARHVAVDADPSDLDEQGRPTAVPAERGSPLERLTRSPELERRLLAEYFERNAAYRRSGVATEARRGAILSTDLRTIDPRYFAGLGDDFGRTVDRHRATTLDAVEFLRTAALVKGISAHSDPTCSMMLGSGDAERLDEAVGGGWWHWRREGEAYVPSYRDDAVASKLHFGLLRTLWQNGVLKPAGPTLYLHCGCEVNTPLAADRVPYDSPDYASHLQIAENLLFYGEGLALLSRAKVFYDAPRGFAESFGGEAGGFGAALATYFEHESRDERLGNDVAGYDRVYFWSILGDWTLTLPSQLPSAEPSR
ncbi:MAG TPA: hypothetical protein PLI18_09670 [Pirellulaceae bacterium]|nr:hypothetical protein [Pirellulaceae bacterium]